MPTTNLTEFTIERGIPIPPRPLLQRRYPFKDMKVGDSIFVPNPTSSLRGYVCTWSRDHGMKFASRRETVRRKNGLRFWRIA